MAHGLEDPVHVLLAIDSDDDNGARGRGHDLPGRLDPVHDRHDQVHEDQVRGYGLAALYGFQAIAGDPHHLVRRLAHDRPAQRFHGQRHIVDDCDLHPCAPPINSATASSRASS
jgi:hypothetical protein